MDLSLGEHRQLRPRSTRVPRAVLVIRRPQGQRVHSRKALEHRGIPTGPNSAAVVKRRLRSGRNKPRRGLGQRRSARTSRSRRSRVGARSHVGKVDKEGKRKRRDAKARRHRRSLSQRLREIYRKPILLHRRADARPGTTHMQRGHQTQDTRQARHETFRIKKRTQSRRSARINSVSCAACAYEKTTVNPRNRREARKRRETEARHTIDSKTARVRQRRT